MDEFSYLSVLLSVILGLAVAQILKGFRGLLLSRARVRLLLAGLRLGRARAAGLFPELVVDVWDAQSSRLDFSAIRHGLAANDTYLHGGGIGFPRFVW